MYSPALLHGLSGKRSQPEFVLPPPPLIEKVAGFIHKLSKTGRPAQENLNSLCNNYWSKRWKMNDVALMECILKMEILCYDL